MREVMICIIHQILLEKELRSIVWARLEMSPCTDNKMYFMS